MILANAPSLADIIAAPKVLLHDHLDGGLRPETVIELADRYGYELPFATADQASEWFFCGGDDIGNLPLYLEKFRHTIGVMQHADALHQVAKECAEDGFPPQRHLEAFQYLQRENFHFTIHAGEGFGPRSIWKALQWCGAERLGHGYRIIEDIQFNDGDEARLGSLAQYMVDRRIPLEVCPTSNVHTEGAASSAEHPIGMLAALGFRVTVNTDNRLMSRCSMSSEFHALVTHQGWTMDDITAASINAAKSAFLSYDERNNLIDHILTSSS